MNQNEELKNRIKQFEHETFKLKGEQEGSERVYIYYIILYILYVFVYYFEIENRRDIRSK